MLPKRFGSLFLVIAVIFFIDAINGSGLAQEIGFPSDLYTRPEKTRHTETSVHADIVRFVQTLDENSPLTHVEWIGTSFEGKGIPIVVLADPVVTTPAEAEESGKPVMYIQGNIHGGEVEGKEAILILMREILFGNKGYLLENQILIFCPLFNPDGNDALGPNNRPNQDGSPYLAGERENGEGWDLNRDGLKLETIEVKALTEHVMLRWDPLLFVDMHTTNGTWHGYAITYAPGMHTAGHPGTTDYLNDELLPWVTAKVLERAGFDLFHYGGFYEYPPRTYYGMYHEPRFLTNSMALKNKLAILVETFSHDRFERRITSNVAFLTSLLEYTHAHAYEIDELIQTIEQEVITEIQQEGGSLVRGVSYTYDQPGRREDLLVYEVQGGQRTGKRIWFDDVRVLREHEPVNEAYVPKAYVFPESLSGVADKLREHGVTIIQLTEQETYTGERYTVQEMNRDNRSYQGHYRVTLEGYFESASQSFPAGSWYVDMAQPLAYLIFYLLEPESDDGLVLWNYFDAYLAERGIDYQQVPFPVFKVLTASSGLTDQKDLSNLRSWYDPQSKTLMVSRLTSSHDLTIELLSSHGQVLHRRTFEPGTGQLEISVNPFSDGIYFVRVSGKGRSYTQPLIVRNEE